MPAEITPKTSLAYEGVRVTKQPPWILRVCRTPATGRGLDGTCGMPAATCNGPASRCPECAFSFCAYHLHLHGIRTEVPRDSFKVYMKWVVQRLRNRAQGKPMTEDGYRWKWVDE